MAKGYLYLPPEPMSDSQIDHLLLLKRLFRLVRVLFTSKETYKARIFLAALAALSLSIGLVQILMSYAARDFITALTQRDQAAWLRATWKYVGTFALSIPISVFYTYCGDRLSLSWRTQMTQLLIKRYFFNRAYYGLRGSDSVDNPDQRICEDARMFTTFLVNFSLVIVNSFVTLLAFLGVLWTISGQLVGVLFLYSAVGTGLAILIGKRLVGLHYEQYKKEANFRYSLIRVRDNAESIAFYHGEKREQSDILRRFSEVLANTMRVIGWNRNLGFFTNGYNYLALLIPALVVGPMYMRGAVEFGVVTQAGNAFAQVLAALSVIVAQFDGLSIFAASTRRLGSLWDSLDDFDAEQKREAEEAQIDVTQRGRRLVLGDLTIKTPGGDKTLVRNLSLEVPPGKSIFITGESGVGKSSLLRTIAGLWHPGGGSIERPTLNRMMFLPQKPYMLETDLRGQLMYPAEGKEAKDAEIEAMLERVNLKEIFDRVDGDLKKVVDWTNVLSLGEQQRVSFARLFLKKPVLAFLDEATSALGEDDEQLLYERLQASGISYVSVGHRGTLRKFHDYVLLLKRDGSFQLKQGPGGTGSNERRRPAARKPRAK